MPQYSVRNTVQNNKMQSKEELKEELKALKQVETNLKTITKALAKIMVVTWWIGFIAAMFNLPIADYLFLVGFICFLLVIGVCFIIQKGNHSD
jgi:hypothetical protein